MNKEQTVEDNNVKPALQQAQCTALLEALEQMLNKVEKVKPSLFRLIAYEKWESQLRNLRGVIQLIKDSQPIA